MFDRIDHGAGGLIKRIQLGTLFIAVSLLFCASAFAAEPEKHLPDKHNPDQRKAPASAAERAAERERELRHKRKPDPHKAPASAAERERELRNKHNPDQHKNVTNGNWYPMYYEPGITNVYVTCNGVTPNEQNGYSIGCESPAVWATCMPDNDGGLGPYTMCQCTSYANEQHSGQYQISNCK